MKKENLNQKEIDELNEFVKKGDIIITDSDLVWGVRGYKTKDGSLEVKRKKGKFYGGGISDNYYTFFIDGVKQTLTKDALIAEKAFYYAFINASYS